MRRQVTNALWNGHATSIATSATSAALPGNPSRGLQAFACSTPQAGILYWGLVLGGSRPA
eukprot:15369816-Alexandrium_andersonii.AAC.1